MEKGYFDTPLYSPMRVHCDTILVATTVGAIIVFLSMILPDLIPEIASGPDLALPLIAITAAHPLWIAICMWVIAGSGIVACLFLGFKPYAQSFGVCRFVAVLSTILIARATYWALAFVTQVIAVVAFVVFVIIALLCLGLLVRSHLAFSESQHVCSMTYEIQPTYDPSDPSADSVNVAIDSALRRR